MSSYEQVNSNSPVVANTDGRVVRLY